MFTKFLRKLTLITVLIINPSLFAQDIETFKFDSFQSSPTKAAFDEAIDLMLGYTIYTPTSGPTGPGWYPIDGLGYSYDGLGRLSREGKSAGPRTYDRYTYYNEDNTIKHRQTINCFGLFCGTVQADSFFYSDSLNIYREYYNSGLPLRAEYRTYKTNRNKNAYQISYSVSDTQFTFTQGLATKYDSLGRIYERITYSGTDTSIANSSIIVYKYSESNFLIQNLEITRTNNVYAYKQLIKHFYDNSGFIIIDSFFAAGTNGWTPNYIINSIDHTQLGSVKELISGSISGTTYTPTRRETRTYRTFIRTGISDPYKDSQEKYCTQNYPNPFNPVTTIGYALPNRGRVTIDVFNSLGEKISTLINEEKEPGNYTVSFNGSRYASGVYFYRVNYNGNIITKRMMMVK